MKNSQYLLIAIFAIGAIAMASVVIHGTWFLLDCTGPDKFLVWGNTYKYGFTTWELQCYKGRFE